MTQPRTLDEAMVMVPEYVLLRPGVDVWQEGDEFFSQFHLAWFNIQKESIGNIIGSAYWSQDLMVQRNTVARREIPPHILDNQAFWLFFDATGQDQEKDSGAVSVMHKPCGKSYIEAWETDVSGVESPGFKYCPHCGKRLKNLRERIKSWLTGGDV